MHYTMLERLAIFYRLLLQRNTQKPSTPFPPLDAVTFHNVVSNRTISACVAHRAQSYSEPGVSSTPKANRYTKHYDRHRGFQCPRIVFLPVGIIRTVALIQAGIVLVGFPGQS